MKPVFFNTENVQAILHWRKTQTRRVIKFPKDLRPSLLPNENFSIQYLGEDVVLPGFESDYRHFCVNPEFYIDIKAPYCKGDILYVRETWAKRIIDRECIGNITGACPYESCDEPPGSCFTGEEYIYRADYFNPDSIKWRPSIHMPAEAARLFLEVKNVRVERLQDISDEDAKAEGANFKIDGKGYNVGWEEKMKHSAVERFQKIWDRTTSEEIYKWRSNPWVWVIDFERKFL